MHSVISLGIMNGTWMANYSGPCMVEIMGLFGTNMLPTAFTEKTPAETVRQSIAALNPGVIVRVV